MGSLKGWAAMLTLKIEIQFHPAPVIQHTLQSSLLIKQQLTIWQFCSDGYETTSFMSSYFVPPLLSVTVSLK
jgi:hypothetical protein